jgi:hypothetical protein
MKVEELIPGNVFVVKNFLTLEECDKFIKESEEKGYKPATIAVDTKEKKEVYSNLVYYYEQTQKPRLRFSFNNTPTKV